jgi:hypothetical protein
MKNFDRQFLAHNFGIHAPMVQGIFEDSDYMTEEARFGMDAQPTLITQMSSGIPAFLTNFVDPEFIRILVTPNKAAVILGEVKKGDWTDQTAQFPVVESTGEVSSYGDWNENGSVGENVNWVPRQSYLFQTITQWGQLEIDRAGRARIPYAANLNIASALVLDKFLNNTYFYGVSGLQNFGLLNDPSLPASSVPGTKAAGGTTWAVATAAEIYTDIASLYGQLVNQTQGLIDRETKMILALSPQDEAQLVKTNLYNVNVTDQIKKNFPNLRVEVAVQYATSAGNLVQLIAEEIEGQDTGFCGFNEKMRAHPVIVQTSSWKQKKTSGTWGAVIRMPLAIASMLGI